jgi:phage-related minor tail protein
VELTRLVIEIDSTGALRAIKTLDQLEQQAKETTSATKKLKDVFADMRDIMQGPIAALQMLKRAFDSVVGGYKALTDEFVKGEQATARLEAVLKSGYSTDQMVEMAKSMASLSLFEDDAIVNAQALMATFKMVGADIFPQAITAVMDMATVMGEDLKSAAIRVGKALQEPIQGATALRRVGVQLSDADEELIKQFMKINDLASAQAVIMRELNSEFGGAAKAVSEKASAGMVMLDKAWKDLLETLGAVVVLGADPFVQALIGGVKATDTGIQDSIRLTQAKADATSALVGEYTKIKNVQEAIFEIERRIGVQETLLANSKSAAVRMQASADIAMWRQKIDALQRMGPRGAVPSAATSALPQGLSTASPTPIAEYTGYRSGYGPEYGPEPAGRPKITNMQYLLGEDSFTSGEQNKTGYELPESTVQAWRKLYDAQKDIKALKMHEAFKRIGDSLEYATKDAFVEAFKGLGDSMASGGDNAEGFMKGIGRVGMALLNRLPMLLLSAGLSAIIANPWNPLGWALVGAAAVAGIGAGIANNLTTNAKGNAFGASGVMGFANGGTFTNGIYSKPTMFAHGGGFGVMGEAGPEAVMPLKRSADGRLGVESAGGGGRVSVTVINSGTEKNVTQEEGIGPNGEKQVNIFMRDKTKALVSSGALDSAMRSRYGLAPSGRRAT